MDREGGREDGCAVKSKQKFEENKRSWYNLQDMVDYLPLWQAETDRKWS
jgi:hypothetical protein